MLENISYKKGWPILNDTSLCLEASIFPPVEAGFGLEGGHSHSLAQPPIPGKFYSNRFIG